MRLKKDRENIKEEDLALAKKVIVKLKTGNRVFGNPAEGLKDTLRKKEKELNDLELHRGKLDFLSNDAELIADIAKLKAGIRGEETLAEYLQQVVKYDKELQDIVFFASLSDPSQNSGGDEYVSDSDFVAVYGDHVLILDAKNIPTNPEIPIYIDKSSGVTELVAAGGKSLLELHPSTYVWRKVFQNANVTYLSIRGCVVIVNKSGATIWKNKEWHSSDVKPIHIADLVDFLHTWIEGKAPETSLSLLVTLTKMQIKHDDGGVAMNIRNAMRRFGV